MERERTAYHSGVSEFASFFSLTCLHLFSAVLWESQRFLRKNDARFVLFSICFVEGVHVLFMLFVFIFAYWCPPRFLFHMMFVSFNSNTTGVDREFLTRRRHLSSLPVFSGVDVARSLVFSV